MNENKNVIRLSGTKTNLAASGGLLNGQLGYSTDTYELAFKEAGGTMRYFSSSSTGMSFNSINVNFITSDDDLTITPAGGDLLIVGNSFFADDYKIKYGNTVSSPDVSVYWNTSPAIDQFLIDVSGEQELKSTSGKIKLNAVTSGFGIQLLGYDVNGEQFNAGSGGNKSLGITEDGDLYVTAGGSIDGNGTAGYISLFIDSDTIGNSALFQDSTGIGLGTAAPTKKLTVRSTATDEGISIGYSDAASFDIYRQTSDGVFVYYNNESTHTVFMGQDGLGINTLTPTKKLTIRSIETDEGISFGYSDAACIDIYRKTTNGAYMFSTNESSDIVFSNLAGEAIRITSAGYVGIGEDAPPRPLHVKSGDAGTQPSWSSNDVAIFESAGEGVIQLFSPNTGKGYFQFSDNNSRGIAYYGYNHVDNTTRIGSAGFEVIRILNSGYVGINTTGADRRLDVLDSSGIQARFTHTDSSKYTDIGTDTNGYFNINNSGKCVIIGSATPSDPIGRFNVIDTATNFTDSGGLTTGGLFVDIVNTGTSSTNSTFIHGAYHRVTENASGGTIGGLFGSFNDAVLTLGTVEFDVIGLGSFVDINAGSVGQDIYGGKILVDIESAVTSIGGSVYGQYIDMQVDKAPSGDIVGMYVKGDTIDHIVIDDNASTIGKVKFDTSANFKIETSGTKVSISTTESAATHNHVFENDDFYTDEDSATSGEFAAYSSTITGCTVSSANIYCKRVGKKVFVDYYLQLTKNGTAAYTVSFTVPHTSSATCPQFTNACKTVRDGNSEIGFVRLASSDNEVLVESDAVGTQWTANADVEIYGQLSYECV